MKQFLEHYLRNRDIHTSKVLNSINLRELINYQVDDPKEKEIIEEFLQAYLQAKKTKYIVTLGIKQIIIVEDRLQDIEVKINQYLKENKTDSTVIQIFKSHNRDENELIAIGQIENQQVKEIQWQN